MIEKVRNILEKALPDGFNIIVSEWKGMGSTYLKIMFSPNTVEINRVRGQYPQVVSLSLDLDDLTLEPQVYGGNGGRSIYLIPDENDPKERYLAMASVRVPFRRPKKAEKNVLMAIERFAVNYLKTLKDNRERLMYQDIVDYSFLD